MARRFGEITTVDLSPREEQLLKFARNGLTDQAIANELGISLATIATYWGRIRIKFGPLSRTEIVAKYIDSQNSRSIEDLENEIKILRQQNDSQRSDLISTIAIGLNIYPESVTLFDEDFRIVYANQTMLRWMGCTFEEVIGKRMVDFWPEDRKTRWFEWFDNFKKNPFEADPKTPVYVRHSDGTIKFFVTNLCPFETPEGLRILAIARPDQ